MNKVVEWIAIIFFVLFLGVGILYLIGEESMKKQTECEVNICDWRVHDEWDYDLNKDICYCYTNDKLIIKRLIK